MSQTPNHSSKEDQEISLRFEELQRMLVNVRETGMDGVMLAQRISADLRQLMNSSWLNCSDAITRYEKQQSGEVPLSMKAAIDYSLVADNGLLFLSLWDAGELEKIRESWPDAPETVYLNRSLIM